MKKAIITGADGFIGSNLVRELISENYNIYAVVMNITEAENVLGHDHHIYYIECSMDNYSSLLTHTELIGADYLFHFAWAGVSDKSSSDYKTQINNVKCSCDLQTIANKLKIKRIIFADSIMEFEHIKAVENGYYSLPLRNTYHISKYSARNFIQLMCNNSGMEFVSVLISNVYGVGECSPRLINTAIKSLLEHRHMSFTSAEQMYDFIYITDAVKAIRLAAERGHSNKIYYIGSEKPRPLIEYLCAMREIISPDDSLGIGEIPFRGVALTYREFDITALKNDTGFIPKISFEEGIKKTAEWMKSKLNSTLLK